MHDSNSFLYPAR